jgi:hypothetical protein
VLQKNIVSQEIFAVIFQDVSETIKIQLMEQIVCVLPQQQQIVVLLNTAGTTTHVILTQSQYHVLWMIKPKLQEQTVNAQLVQPRMNVLRIPIVGRTRLVTLIQSQTHVN